MKVTAYVELQTDGCVFVFAFLYVLGLKSEFLLTYRVRQCLWWQNPGPHNFNIKF